MTMTPTVTVAGSLHMDFIAAAERLPVPGESLIGSGCTMHPGGKAGNQATQLALHGIRTFLISRVGDDFLGNELRSRLSGRGVCLDYTTVDPGRPTGASPVFVGQDGQYMSIIVPGAAGALAVDDVLRAREVIEASAALVLQLEVPLATSRAAATLAKSAGARVILNASPISERMAQKVRAAMRGLVDTLIVNELEAELLSEREVASVSDATAAGRVLRESLGCSEVVITLGAAGAVMVAPDAELYQPAFVVPVVDSVGAGDAFAGTLIAMLVKGQALPLALRTAVAAGAIAVGRPGAFDALPTPAEITSLLGRI